ncbi:MAG: hypothetical protein IPK32_23715 [Verrucomicrobiaceae bacterium]|nr:hypothetical protein [Verrucomicrobiaceae bacterium]
MKHIPFLLLPFVFGATPLMSADVELGRLKQSYQDATKRALEPINATYEKELLRLLEKHTKAGKLAEAIEVKEEIERLTGRVIKDTAGTPASPEKSVERFFAGRTWKTGLGTKFDFKRDGSGTRQLGSDKKPIVWKVGVDGIVEVTGEKNGSGTMENWFFKFLSRDEGYIGGAKDKIDGRVNPD